MHRRTKALDISKAVKETVWQRDKYRCILCGSPDAAPNAHYVSRARGGLGIPENVVTLCRECHDHYDNGAGGKGLGPLIATYLREKYPGWREDELRYVKGEAARSVQRIALDRLSQVTKELRGGHIQIRAERDTQSQAPDQSFGGTDRPGTERLNGPANSKRKEEKRCLENA